MGGHTIIILLGHEIFYHHPPSNTAMYYYPHLLPGLLNFHSKSFTHADKFTDFPAGNEPCNVGLYVELLYSAKHHHFSRDLIKCDIHLFLLVCFIVAQFNPQRFTSCPALWQCVAFQNVLKYMTACIIHVSEESALSYKSSFSIYRQAIFPSQLPYENMHIAPICLLVFFLKGRGWSYFICNDLL